MAFALWKKSTYRYVNVALQHERLIPLWNDINHFVTSNALIVDRIQESKFTFDYNHSTDSVYTGVIYKKSSSSGDNIDVQIPEIWFKIIYTEKSIEPQDGIVILMKNSLIHNSEDPTSSNTEANTLRKYCRKNICAEEFQKKFEQIGGQVRCCFWTLKIAEQLGIPNNHRFNRMLQIPTITSLLVYR